MTSDGRHVEESQTELPGRRSVSEILNSRAEILARPLPIEPLASEFLEVLTFTVENEQFAIDTRFVTEVIRDVQITPLPGHTGPLAGVTNLRGEVLAVMSLCGVISVETQTTSTPNGRWVIVLGTDHARFGIAVSRVTEVVAIANGSIQDASRATQISESEIVRGVTKDARIVLDGPSLLNDPRFVIDDREPA